MTGLPSPATSSLSHGDAALGLLPLARSHPLLTGSAKFNTLRNYLDTRVYEINSKLSKSYAGYSTFIDVHKDLDAAIDVLWVSNTPILQVPFLITLSGLLEYSLSLFPWDPIRSLELVAKLDDFFAHLLSESTGLEEGAINNTDRARISSIAQETRLEISAAASRIQSGTVTELPSADNTDTEVGMTTADEADDMQDQPTLPVVGLGNVYEKTVSILGADLNSLPTEEEFTTEALKSIDSDIEVIDL